MTIFQARHEIQRLGHRAGGRVLGWGRQCLMQLPVKEDDDDDVVKPKGI